jgi:hypothetical protein
MLNSATRAVRFSGISVLLALFLASCIGTDLLDESVELVQPYILLTPEVGAIQVGEAVAYEAVYFDQFNEPVSAPFQWVSSNESVVQVSAEGRATGMSQGQARITVTAHDVSSEALLTVVNDPGEVALVEITPPAASVTVGEFQMFSATVKNALGETLADRPITWRTSVDTLAVVDAEGTVQTLRPGRVDVIATVDGIDSAPAKLEIFARNRTGAFRGAEGTAYQISGTVVLEQHEGGGLLLRFMENFSSSNGPDLYVYLSNSTRVNANSLQAGSLQSTSGVQIYDLPAGVGMNDYDYVIIHCLPFNVSFGYAPLN